MLGNNSANLNNGNNMVPIANVDLNGDTNVKLNEDQYEVYVNGDFIGHKTLKTQGEDLSDIDDFLRHQGFADFSTSVEGDHYNIKVNNQEHDVANALSVYFNNR